MAIPLATTTITVKRIIPLDDTADGYDANPPNPTVVADSIRATIGAPSASSQLVGGDQVVFTAQLVCDPCDIQQGDVVTDGHGQDWFVLWARHAPSFGLSHIIGSVRFEEGAA